MLKFKITKRLVLNIASSALLSTLVMKFVLDMLGVALNSHVVSTFVTMSILYALGTLAFLAVGKGPVESILEDKRDNAARILDSWRTPLVEQPEFQFLLIGVAYTLMPALVLWLLLFTSPLILDIVSIGWKSSILGAFVLLVTDCLISELRSYISSRLRAAPQASS